MKEVLTNLHLAVPDGTGALTDALMRTNLGGAAGGLGRRNFVIETRLELTEYTPGQEFQAGLAVELAGGETLLWGLRNGTRELVLTRGGQPTTVLFRGWGQGSVYLRVEKSGHIYTLLHKAEAGQRWVSDGQYRDATQPVVAVGVALTAPPGVSVQADSTDFHALPGTDADDIGETTGNARTFGPICTRYVPAYGPVVDLPANIQGEGRPNKNLRIALPGGRAFDLSPAADDAPQVYRDDLGEGDWTAETVATLVYAGGAACQGGLLVWFGGRDAVYWGLTGDQTLVAARTGRPVLATVPLGQPRVWLQAARRGTEYTLAYKLAADDEWTAALTLAAPARAARAGVSVRSWEPTEVGFDFGYLTLERAPLGPSRLPAIVWPPRPATLRHPDATPRHPGLDPGSTPTPGTPLVLQNPHLRLQLDPTTGALTRISNQANNLDLIDPAYQAQPDEPAWKLATAPGQPEADWLTPAQAGAQFSAAAAPGRLDLQWACQDGLTVRAAIVLEPDAREAVFTAEVTNTGQQAVYLLEYPVVRGVGTLVAGDIGHNYLLTPYGTGFLFTDPLELFPDGSGLPCPYPEGFNGASTQIMAYYRADVGGFSFMTDDGTGWVKWLDCDKPDDHLRFRFLHSACGVQPGNELHLPYSVRLGALVEGNWYEAAERYRAWALAQPWCDKGPWRQREDKAVWLLEQTGAAAMGISTQYDRTAWLEHLHRDLGTSIFHITGPNWQLGRFDYLGNMNGGTDMVFPAPVAPSYLETLAAQGDHFAPFTFATAFSEKGSVDYPAAAAAMQKIPGRDTPGQTDTLSRDRYSFPFLCPVPPFQAQLSVFRDTGAVRELGASAIYWDIGPNNILLSCLDESHGHPAGGGAVLPAAYLDVMATVRQACREAAGGEVVPLGCEMVNEVFLSEMDFYQARAEASPVSAFEAGSFYHWIREGTCVKVPLFAFVYHDHGPVRLDGWAKLDDEQGDLFYWLAARIVAWGGLFEINGEFSSLDVIDGHCDDMSQSFSPFVVDRYYQTVPQRAAYVRGLAAARTGFALPYLAYGQMLRPLAFEAPLVDLDWFHFNCAADFSEYQQEGVLTVPSVVHAAWRYGAEKCGFFFVNVLEQSQTVTVTLDPAAYGLDEPDGAGDANERHVYLVEEDRQTDLGAIDGPRDFALVLPARRPVLLELR
ncbi:MAG: DUF6259 domain-containing protein [Bifidobacteriaceae bacterium]|nr:DUF6259 domain-containing protein [Bifidobacteriaceae bacterium]